MGKVLSSILITAETTTEPHLFNGVLAQAFRLLLSTLGWYRNGKCCRCPELIVRHHAGVLNYHINPPIHTWFKLGTTATFWLSFPESQKRYMVSLPSKTPAAPAGGRNLVWPIQEPFPSLANASPPSGLTLQFLLAFALQAFNYLTRNPSPAYCHFLADLATKSVICGVQDSIFVHNIKPVHMQEQSYSLI